MKKRNLFMYLCIAAFCLFMITPAQAVPYGFNGIVTDESNSGDIAIGEAQLFVDVTDAGNGQVLFTFTNTGPAASSICDVYFDDGTLLGIASISSSAGVFFSEGPVSPSNLPGGNEISPPFEATQSFLVDSDSPVFQNGVNPDEWLGILFDLQSGRTYDHVMSDLSSGALRIGIHVQGFDSQGSESFVNDPNPVPEPSTYLLILIGMLGIISVKGIRKS